MLHLLRQALPRTGSEEEEKVRKEKSEVEEKQGHSTIHCTVSIYIPNFVNCLVSACFQASKTQRMVLFSITDFSVTLQRYQ